MRILRMRVTDLAWGVLPLLCLSAVVFGVRASGDRVPADEAADVNEVIDRFQEAYSNQRIDDLRDLFFSEAVVAWDFEGGSRQDVHSLEEWLESTRENVFEPNSWLSDTLSNRQIEVFGNIAYVVCEYEYRDRTHHHRGIDIFTLMKMRGRWRILSLQWTGESVQ